MKGGKVMGTKINWFLRKIYNFFHRRKLKNKTFTLIASNCNGGSILHDLGLEFNTPFINLSISPDDFIRLCANLEYYLNCELTFCDTSEEDVSYPVGKLDDVKLDFMHYSSEEEARLSWEARKKRVKLDNLFFLFSDRGGCTYEMLKAYDALPYKHKVVFVNREYPELDSARYIPGFETQDCVGVCLYFKNPFTYQRYYDAFDYVSWFNENGVQS